MAISSRCVCITENKNVFEITKAIEHEIKLLIKKFRKTTSRIDKENMVQGMNLSPSCGMVTFNFTLKGEQRNLHIHFDCDCDQEHLGNKKIICSLGSWGLNQEIIAACANAMAPFGPVYTQLNDCLDLPFVQWDKRWSDNSSNP